MIYVLMQRAYDEANTLFASTSKEKVEEQRKKISDRHEYLHVIAQELRIKEEAYEATLPPFSDLQDGQLPSAQG